MEKLFFIDNTGAVQECPADRVIVHEMIHAIDGSLDTTKDLSGAIPVTTADYQGATVAKENDFYDIDRPSYSAQFTAAELPYLAARPDLPGTSFDQVLLNGVDVREDAPATSPGYNLITARNTGAGNVNDLLIAWNYSDTTNTGHTNHGVFAAGVGNDYICAGVGSDKIFGGAGNDYINGGSGYSAQGGSANDVAIYFDYSGDASGTGQHGIQVSWHRDQLLVTDAWGGQDTLVGIEEIQGTALDDSFQIWGPFWDVVTSQQLDDVPLWDGGAGIDTLILDTSEGLLVDLGHGYVTDAQKDILLNGFENITGSAHNDTITGDDNANVIKGNAGADELRGNGGDDVILFDAEDTVVSGGAGFDRAIAEGNGVTIDLDAQGFEAFAGTDGADVIRLSASNTGPKIVWGGGGADVFQFHTDPEVGGQAGIYVVNVAGMTAEAFQNVTLESLGLGGLDLSQIDAVVINPDAGDRFFINDEPMGIAGTASDYVSLFLPGIYDEAVLGGRSYDVSGSGAEIQLLSSDVLGRAMTMQGGWSAGYTVAVEVGWTMQLVSAPMFVAVNGGEATFEEFVEARNAFSAAALGALEYEHEGWIYTYYYRLESYVDDPADFPTGGASWFVAGGSFDGFVLSGDSVLSA
jgi:Ca2+-binding RTX toxin-like protein